jgi:hypothetical protein
MVVSPGAGSMAAYRAFIVDEDGHIRRPPHVFDSDGDGQAIKQARQFVDSRDVELWDHDRFVALIGPDGVRPKV